jgi:peptide/nickel transport system permease protein
VIGFILKRLLQAAFVVVAVSLVVAVAIRMTGDPALMISQGATGITEADLQRIREGLGLNEPFIVQYLNSLAGLLTWSFGNSFVGGTPVNILISKALPATLMLAFTSLFLSIVISIPLGIRAVTLRWLPPSGMSGFESFIMPTLTMGVILTATNVRLVRTTMLETLNAQYIMVARAKGLSENKVLYKHALRNCAIPLITYFGLQFGGLLGGIVVIERVFNWPGMGTLAFDAVAARDYPVLQAVIMILSLMIVLVNLAVDIAYGLVDPRIRKE